jgi:GNAT superfamily N-acetyltransferase
MCEEMKPIRVESIEAYDWTEILLQSESEGYGMVKRLVDDFSSGVNRFDKPGEALFVFLSGNMVQAVGGLNREEDSRLGNAGRIRRLYVMPEMRRRGIARSIVDEISTVAVGNFQVLVVNVGPADAHGFYEHLGFQKVDHPGITHFKDSYER